MKMHANLRQKTDSGKGYSYEIDETARITGDPAGRNGEFRWDFDSHNSLPLHSSF